MFLGGGRDEGIATLRRSSSLVNGVDEGSALLAEGPGAALGRTEMFPEDQVLGWTEIAAVIHGEG